MGIWGDDSPQGPRKDRRSDAPSSSNRWRNKAGGSPNSSFLGGEQSLSPYRPYQSHDGSGRFPQPGMLPADQTAGWTAAHIKAMQHANHRFSIFHDGNAGHLWRGEVASLFGEAMLSTGIVMWLSYLTGSVFAVALALVALGLPWLIAGPLGTRLRNAEEPGIPLAWLGRLRIFFVLVLIPMHFFTIFPVVYAALFAASLCGRLREHLRVAAIRTCLAPGELEKVSDDLHIGAAVAAVAGPLLASLLFLLLGERILLVSVGCAVAFLLSMNSDHFLDALPKNQRAFLLATPETAYPEDAWETGEFYSIAEDDEEEPEYRRELRLPEWYQVGPGSAFQAIGELRVGLGLAGGGKASRWALLALGVVAFVSGGLAVLEVFLLEERLHLSPFYLGPLLAAEATGVALGAMSSGGKGNGRSAWLGGTVGAGIMLVVLAFSPWVPVTLIAALLLGMLNGNGVAGARKALYNGFSSVERRAISSAEIWLTALCSVVGAALFAVFYGGTSFLPPSVHLPMQLVGWPLTVLLPGAGIGLVIAGIATGVSAGKADAQAEQGDANAEDSAVGTIGRLAAAHDDWDDDPSNDSTYQPAAGNADWDDDYTGQRSASRYRAPNNYDDDDDDDDDPGDPRPRGRSGLAPRRPLPGGSGGGRSLLGGNKGSSGGIGGTGNGGGGSGGSKNGGGRSLLGR